MIKVLKKTFDILELIAQREDAVFSGEIARTLDLNLPTCSRILKDLAEMGYVEQVATKKGYILGPASYNLSAKKSYRRDLTEIVDPMVKECAYSLKESVLFTILKNTKRYILSHHNGNPELQVIIDKPFYEDAYVTATGRVQLAYCEKDEVEKYIAKNGLPGMRWDNINTREKFDKALEKVRFDGFYADKRPDSQLAIVGFPVFQRDKFIGALGCSLLQSTFSGERKEKVIAEIGRNAELVTAALHNEI